MLSYHVFANTNLQIRSIAFSFVLSSTFKEHSNPSMLTERRRTDDPRNIYEMSAMTRSTSGW